MRADFFADFDRDTALAPRLLTRPPGFPRLAAAFFPFAADVPFGADLVVVSVCRGCLVGPCLASAVDERESHFVADRVITPDLVHMNLVVLAQPAGNIHHSGWHIQMEVGLELGEVRPLGQGLEVVHRLARFNLDDNPQPMAPLLREKDQVRKESGRPTADGGLLFSAKVYTGFVSAAKPRLQEANNTVVLELFADRPYQNGTH